MKNDIPEEKIIECEPRLKYFPIPLFAITMGLTGLAIAFEKASQILHIPSGVGIFLSYISLGIFFLLLFLYLLKLIKYPEEVKKEWNHVIRMNFFPAISISMLLLSIAFSHINPSLSKVFWYIAAPLHLFFTLRVIKFWIENNIQINHSNPAWFIPIVGNVIVPIMGVKYGGVTLSQFYFSLGIFFWVVLFTIVIYRIIFHHQLPSKFIPTLFIFIAPPAVGFISYVKIKEAIFKLLPQSPNFLASLTLDFFAHFLYDVAFFFIVMLVFMIKLFTKVPYSITWWAYTFPLDAFTIATLVNYHLNKVAESKGLIKSELIFGALKSSDFFYILSWISLTITTIVIFVVAYKTIKAILNRKICVPE